MEMDISISPIPSFLNNYLKISKEKKKSIKREYEGVTLITFFSLRTVSKFHAMFSWLEYWEHREKMFSYTATHV